MLFVKNLPSWERVVRPIAGLATLALGLYFFPGSLTGYVVAASGAFMALSGFFGFCPACALAGRRPRR